MEQPLICLSELRFRLRRESECFADCSSEFVIASVSGDTCVVFMTNEFEFGSGLCWTLGRVNCGIMAFPRIGQHSAVDSSVNGSVNPIFPTVESSEVEGISENGAFSRIVLPRGVEWLDRDNWGDRVRFGGVVRQS